MPAVLSLDDERRLAHLAEGEVPRVFVRQHPFVLLRPAGYALGGTVLWLWLAGSVPAGRVMDILLVAVLAAWVWLLWAEIERRVNFIGVTDKRIFRTEGIFTRRYPAMRISKVTDVTLVRTIPGRAFRYSKIIIESAGQEQALHDLDYIPYDSKDPSRDATGLLWAELFGSRPRARKAGKDRRHRLRGLQGIPGLRRWRDDGDEDEEGQGPDDDGGPPDDTPPTGGDTGARPGEDRPGPVREGDPRRGRRLLDEDTDVPSAGDWRAHPRPQTLYQSPDLRPRTRRTEDTGPIPISTRRADR